MPNMTTFVLMISRKFPVHHPKAGSETFFKQKICAALGIPATPRFHTKKYHTARANYQLWSKRIHKINKGEAILSLREWSGEPYRSKQIEICKLTKVGLQKIRLDRKMIGKKLVAAVTIDKNDLNQHIFAINDGFTTHDDMLDWFPRRFQGALIHFDPEFKY